MGEAVRTEVRTTYTLPNELAGRVGMEGKGLAGMGLYIENR